MTRTVILVLVLIIANSQGKVVVQEQDIADPSLSIISKDKLELSAIHIELPTTQATDLDDEAKNVKLRVKLVSTNEIDEDDTVAKETEKVSEKTPEDTGVPLILTPFIEQGLIAEARNASRVDPSLFLGFESYTGFFTVNKTYNSNVFFWYFPVENKPVNETPWIIWLQGGPGASSLTGLFDEIGPFKYTSADGLKRQPYSWLRNHSLLFIDNPVGSGYSFTEHIHGYVKDMTTCSDHLYSTVHQFLQIFPELRAAPLYIAGESYAGKYVPALAMQIHKHKAKPAHDINLQGIVVGNGYVDPSMISNVTQSFFYFGLLDRSQIEIVEPLLHEFQQDIATNNSIAAKNKWIGIISLLLVLSQQHQAYNFLKDDLALGDYTAYLERADVKRAIHVGEAGFAMVNFTTNVQMAPDFLVSTKPLFEELLNHYRVLTYCGHLDQMLPCVFSAEHYRTWQWDGSAEFRNATRYPIMFNKRLTGYSKSGGGLTDVVVRGAGHMVPLDAPAPAQRLVASFTHRRALAAPSRLLDRIRDYIANNTDVYL